MREVTELYENLEEKEPEFGSAEWVQIFDKLSAKLNDTNNKLNKMYQPSKKSHFKN